MMESCVGNIKGTGPSSEISNSPYCRQYEDFGSDPEIQEIQKLRQTERERSSLFDLFQDEGKTVDFLFLSAAPSFSSIETREIVEGIPNDKMKFDKIPWIASSIACDGTGPPLDARQVLGSTVEPELERHQLEMMREQNHREKLRFEDEIRALKREHKDREDSMKDDLRAAKNEIIQLRLQATQQLHRPMKRVDPSRYKGKRLSSDKDFDKAFSELRKEVRDVRERNTTLETRLSEIQAHAGLERHPVTSKELHHELRKVREEKEALRDVGEKLRSYCNEVQKQSVLLEKQVDYLRVQNSSLERTLAAAFKSSDASDSAELGARPGLLQLRDFSRTLVVDDSTQTRTESTSRSTQTKPSEHCRSRDVPVQTEEAVDFRFCNSETVSKSTEKFLDSNRSILPSCQAEVSKATSSSFAPTWKHRSLENTYSDNTKHIKPTDCYQRAKTQDRVISESAERTQRKSTEFQLLQPRQTTDQAAMKMLEELVEECRKLRDNVVAGSDEPPS